MRGCLDNLLRQTLGQRLEIIVIDSGSPEKKGALFGSIKGIILIYAIFELKNVKLSTRHGIEVLMQLAENMWSMLIPTMAIVKMPLSP